jgi:pyruvate ferredoxin oxidoreductase gamma subunit
MYQIRIHGRGGQGAVTAAELIAIAAFEDRKYSQAFPSFGVERTGAPVESFARIDNKPIRTREQIYNPDVLVVLDATLLEVIDIAGDCDENTRIIVNTGKEKDELNIPIKGENIYTVDATRIALDVIGRNVANTTTLGAFAKATDLISIKGLEKAIKQKFEEKGKDIVNKNIEAVKRAYK